MTASDASISEARCGRSRSRNGPQWIFTRRGGVAWERMRTGRADSSSEQCGSFAGRDPHAAPLSSAAEPEDGLWDGGEAPAALRYRPRVSASGAAPPLAED